MTLDFFNGCFEFAGGIVNILNVRALLRDKKVQGVSPIPFVLFTLWGWWNLKYYSGLEQWFSFTGGILIVTVNSIWCLLALYYILKNNGDLKAMRNVALGLTENTEI